MKTYALDWDPFVCLSATGIPIFTRSQRLPERRGGSSLCEFATTCVRVRTWGPPKAELFLPCSHYATGS
eukprot:2871142-Pleurochrysis_carterae.AAC.1